MGGAHNATEDEFVMHSVPRCLDNQGEKLQGVGLSGARVESLPTKGDDLSTGACFPGKENRVFPMAFTDFADFLQFP